MLAFEIFVYCLRYNFEDFQAYIYRVFRLENMKPITRRNKSTYALSLGSILLTFGGALLISWPWIVNFLQNSILSLRTETTFNLWKKNPMPITFDIYIFNWTNPEDIYKPNTKPILQEIGPFVFEETKEKVNLTWNNNNTITFEHLRYWYFDEKKSVANLSTKVITVNAIAVTAGYILRDRNFLLKKGFDFSMKSLSLKIYKETTVGEMLFEGYSDPLINIARALPIMGDLQIPPMDRFGWFYTRNGSSTFDGTFNMHVSGENFGAAEQWNYKHRTPYYHDDCNIVRGSAGELFPPNLQKTNVGFFSSDICRYVPLDYEREVVVDGTTGYKFVLGQSFLDNGTNVPENKCFVMGENVHSGIFNVSSCRYGSPSFVSQPHFYGADPYYTSLVDGMDPKKDKHQMFMTLEPKTAIPLRVEARLQLNLLILPVKSISILEGVPKLFMPIIWFEQKVQIPNTYSILLKIFLKLPTILQCIGGTMVLISIAVIVFVIYTPLLSKKRYKVVNQKTIIGDDIICDNSKGKSLMSS